jgi:hypothetical protein
LIVGGGITVVSQVLVAPTLFATVPVKVVVTATLTTLGPPESPTLPIPLFIDILTAPDEFQLILVWPPTKSSVIVQLGGAGVDTLQVAIAPMLLVKVNV